MNRITTLAALGTMLAAGLAIPSSAGAAVSSATIAGQTAILNLDGADDAVTVSVSGGLLVHGQVTGGLNSGADWDSAAAGDQTVPANGTFGVVIDGGDGNDAVTVLAKTTELTGAKLLGSAGDDVLTGADTADSLSGGDGDDRLIGAKGSDEMAGDAGNDTLVWNNGDGTDTMDGGVGNDGAEVNGSPTAGDAFTLAPDENPGQVKFQRTNLVPFTIHSTTERFLVNGLGGNDTLASSDGVGARTLLSVDGGVGADSLNGSDGPDLLLGGDGNDLLDGGGGDDRIAGDRGTDTMNGGSGDDTLVWNNGDGTDVDNGDAGRDDVEVNGAPAAGDVFAVQPSGGRIRFDRTNLVPFSLDIGTSETMHANGLGGDDTISIGEVGSYDVTAAGGSGSDLLTGGGSSATFRGGSGNDTINAGAGIDAVFGDDGDDHVDVRDGTADLAFGGDGNDSVVADRKTLDTLDGFEIVDRTPNATPATRPVTIRGHTVKVRRGTASIEVHCPAGSRVHCTGSLVVRTAKVVKRAGRKARLQLGSVRYDVAPGATRRLKVKLAKSSRRLADSRGHLRVVAVASTDDASRVAHSSRHLTLALAR
jgi:Ca2+-binding RTX toxin-like protein